MSASLGLFRLQQIDTQIDRAKTRLSGIQKTLENDKELKAVHTRFETTKSENQNALLAAKNAEAEVDAMKIKIEQVEASLYGGVVKNPKELQDLQKNLRRSKTFGDP
ncbi:MAG: hypothetical protein IPJ47_21650 [Anaerolineales bacterium]|nr:hypothetical protein [Anaerolineales bacterium]